MRGAYGWVIFFAQVVGYVSGGRSVDISRNTDFIVNRHNNYRRRVYAADMMKLVWDDRLAHDASVWSRTCSSQQNHRYGQNVYVISKHESRATPGTMITHAMHKWYQTGLRHRHWKLDCGDSCPFEMETFPGYFMMWAKATNIGCGLAECDVYKDGQSVQYDVMALVCYYWPRARLLKEFPFIRGRRCTECPEDSRCDSGLCVSNHYRESSDSYGTQVARIRQRPLKKHRDHEKKLHRQHVEEMKRLREAARLQRQHDDARRREMDKAEAERRRHRDREAERRRHKDQEAERRRLRDERRRQQMELRQMRKEERNKDKKIVRSGYREVRRKHRCRGPVPTSRDRLTTQELHFLAEGTNVVRKHHQRNLRRVKWSKLLANWANYIVRCNKNFPGPRNMYTTFDKAEYSEALYCTIYDWYGENQTDIYQNNPTCRMPEDRGLCSRKTVTLEPKITQIGCAARDCSTFRQLTCIYH